MRATFPGGKLPPAVVPTGGGTGTAPSGATYGPGGKVPTPSEAAAKAAATAEEEAAAAGTTMGASAATSFLKLAPGETWGRVLASSASSALTKSLPIIFATSLSQIYGGKTASTSADSAQAAQAWAAEVQGTTQAAQNLRTELQALASAFPSLTNPALGNASLIASNKQLAFAILTYTQQAERAGLAIPFSFGERSAADKALGLTGLNVGSLSPTLLTDLLQAALGGGAPGKGGAAAQKIGEEIIAGLTAGLKGKPETKTFENLIADVRSLFGVKSPSKMFKDIGMMNMQGLANGITTNAGLVQAAMASVVDKTLASLTADVPRFKSAGAGLTASLLAGAGSVPAFHGAGAGGGNIEITSHITFQLTGMPDMTHGSTFSRQLKSALDEHDRKLVQAIRSGRS